MTCEKIFHLPGRSAEHALQGALSLRVCLAPNTMVTPVRAVSSGIQLSTSVKLLSFLLWPVHSLSAADAAHYLVAHHVGFGLSVPAAGKRSAGNTWSSSSRRGSNQAGSSKRIPSCSTGSSTVKPGGSVAISKRMPPGSRK